MWYYFWTYLYVGGILLSLVSIFNWQSEKAHWFKLLFSISFSWLFLYVLANQPGDDGTPLLDTLLFMLFFPSVVFIGVQMFMYNWFY